MKSMNHSVLLQFSFLTAFRPWHTFSNAEINEILLNTISNLGVQAVLDYENADQ